MNKNPIVSEKLTPSSVALRGRTRVNAIWLMNAATLALTVAGVVKSSTFEAKGANYYWTGVVGDFKTGAVWWDGSSPGSTTSYSAIGTTANTTFTDTLYFGSNPLSTGATFNTTINVGSSNRTAQSVTFVSGAAAYTFNGNSTRKWDIGSSSASYTPASAAVQNNSTSAQTFNIMIAAASGSTAAKAVEFKQNDATGSLNFNTTATSFILNPYAYDWAIAQGSTAAQAASFAAKGQSIQISQNSSSAGYIKFSGSGTINVAGTIDENARLNFGQNTNPFASVKGTGNVIITNTGTTNLSGWNTYTGTTTIGDGTTSGGVVVVGTPYAFGGNRIGDITAPNSTSAANAFGGSSATAYFAGTLASGFSASTVAYGAVTVYSGMTVDLKGQTMLGRNTMTVSGSGASGSGVIRNTSTSAATYAGSVVLAANSTISAGSGALTFSGGLNAAAYNATFNGTVATTISGVLAGSGTITKSGAGTLTFSGDNTYSGSLAINAGKVSLGGGSGTALSTTGALSFGASSSGTLALTGRGASVGAISGDSTATIENNHASDVTLTSSASSDTTFAGVIKNGAAAGKLAFTKAGSGALTLSNTNTYTGDTAINAGTINLTSTGSIASKVTVGASGTLHGSGSIGGDLQISGKINPGDTGIGMLTAGTVGLNGGGILNIQFYSGSGTEGTTGWDLLQSTGAVTINSTSGSVFTINLNSISSSISEALSSGGTANAFDNTLTKEYKIISGSSILGTFDANKFAISATNLVTPSGLNGGSWSVTSDSTAIYAKFTAADLSTALTWSSSGWLASGGLGGDGTWSNDSGAYDSAKTATFAGTAGTVTVTTATANKGIAFQTTGYNLTGGTITVSGSSDADNTITVDGGLTATIASAISSSVKLTKASDGTLVLSGDNSGMTGGLTVTAGVVKVGSTNALGANSNAVTVGTTGTLDVNGTNMVATNALSLTGTLTNSATSAATYAGQVTLATTKSIGGALGGNLTLSGGVANNGFGLTLNPSANTLTVNGVSGTGNVSITNSSNGAVALTGTINNTGTITNDGTGSSATTISGNLGSSVTGVTQNSSTSSLLLSGDNSSYTGGVTISAGTVKVGSTNALGANSSSVTVATGGTLDVNGTTMVATNSLTLNGTSTLTNSATSAATYAGQVTLGAAKSIGGAIGANLTLSGGVANGGNALTLNPSANTLTVNGVSGTGNVTVTNSSTGSVALTGTINNTGSITNNGAGSSATTISGNLGANVTSLTQNSATSSLVLSGDNTSYTNAATVSSGLLKLGSNTALVNSAVSVNAATAVALDLNGTTNTNAKTLTLQGTGIVADTSTSYGSGTVALSAGSLYNSSATKAVYNGNITLGGATTIGTWKGGDIDLNGNITGSNTLTIGGNGVSARTVTLGGNLSGALSLSAGESSTGGTNLNTIVLSGTNTNSGTLKISSGTVKAMSTNALSASSTLNSGGSLTDNSKLQLTAGLSYNMAALSVGGQLGIESTDTAQATSITFTNASGNGITGSLDKRINVGAGVTVNINGIFDVGVTNTAARFARLGGAGNYVFNGVVQSSGTNPAGLSMEGTGTLTLNNANTYGGGTKISAGTVKLGNVDALGSVSSGVIMTGGTLDLNGFTPTNSYALSSTGGTITNTGTNAVNYYGLITMTGATTLNASGADLTISNGGSMGSPSGSLTLNAESGKNGVLNSIYNGSSSSYGVIKTGAGTWTLNGLNLYTGGTQIQAGTLKMGSVQALGNTSNASGTVYISSGATLDLNGFTNSKQYKVTMGGTGVGGNGALINSSSTSAKLYSAVELTADTLIVANNAIEITSSASSRLFNTAGYTLTLDGTSTSSSNTIGDSIVGSGKIIKKGAGTWTLNPTNNTVAQTYNSQSNSALDNTNYYTGGTEIQAGTLKIAKATALGDSSSAVSVSSGASLDLVATTMTNANQLTISGTGVSSVGALTNSNSSNATYIGNIILADDALIRAATGTINLSGVISGTGKALTLSAASTKSVNFTGTNANTFSGGLVLAGNDVQFSQVDQLGSGTISSTDATSRLYLNGTSANVTITNDLNTGTAASTVLAIAPNVGNVVTANGLISGSGQFKVSGGGTLIVTNTSNAYSGGTEVGTGTIQVSSDSVLGSGAVNFGTAGTGTTAASVLAYTDNNTTTRNFTIGSTGSSSAYQAGIDVAFGKTVALNGTISNKATGAGKLTKTGNGTLTLGGTNTYSGATTVAAGTLNLTGSIASSAVSLSNAATLTATNSITESNVAAASDNVASLTVNSGSALNLLAGSLKGTSMTVSATDGVNADAIINYSFGNTIALSGALTLTGALNINLTSDVSALTAGTYDIIRFGSKTGSGSITLSGTQSNTDWLVSGEFLASAYRITVAAAFTDGQAASSGTVTVPTNKVLGDVSGANTVVNLNNTGSSISGTVSGGTINVNESASIATLNGGTVAVAANKTLSVAAGSSDGSISGTGTLAKTGNGTLTLSGDNSGFSGVAKVSAGTLEVTAASAINSAANVDLGTADDSTAAKFKVSSSSATEITTDINALGSDRTGGGNVIQNAGSGALTLSGDLTKDGTVLTLDGGSAGITVSGTIKGTSVGSDLFVTGGTTTLTAQNTYVGPTNVYGGGTLVNGNAAGALPTNTVLTLGSGTTSGTFNLNGNGQSVAGLVTDGSAGTSNVVTNNGAADATLTVSGNGTTASTFAGKIQDGSTNKTALVVSGGTLDLTAANTYTGNTSVTGGTLLTGNDSALGTGTVSVASAATLAAGDASTSALTLITGGYALSNGAVLRVYVGTIGNNTVRTGPLYVYLPEDQFYDQSGYAGNNYTSFATSGALDVSGVTAGGITVELYNDPLATNTWKSGNRYDFTFMTFGNVTGLGNNLTLSELFTFDATNLYAQSGKNMDAWGINAFMKYDNAGTLTMSIPEPSTYGLGLGALALAFAAYRRRQAKAKQVVA